MTRLIAMLALAGVSCVALGAPPITEPVEVTVTNPVVPVEVTNADPIPVNVVPSSRTHMGVSSGDHVALYLGGATSTCPAGYAVGLTVTPGGQPAGVFEVPEGKALVITDLSLWLVAASGIPWNVGDQLQFKLYSGASIFPVWQVGKSVDATASAARQLWFTEALTTGAMIGPGHVCAEVPGTKAVLFNSSMLHGYLVDYQAP